MSQNPEMPASAVGGSPAARVPRTARAGVTPRSVQPQTFARELANLASPGWLYAFLAIEIGLQLLILTPWGESSRILVRTGAFAASFVLLFFLRRTPVAYPARSVAIAALAVVTLSILHPDTNGIWAGCATAFLHLAVFAPIFWVPRIRIDVPTVRRVFVVFWVFNTASAVLGALQVRFPGRFDPAISSAMDDGYLQGLSFPLSNGQQILRPMGLTNQPGGAAIGAMYCVILGVALLLSRPRPWIRALLAAGVGIAIFTLCLSMVRSFVAMTVIGLFALGFPLAAQRRVGRFVGLAASIVVLALVAFTLAVLVGGDSVTNRLGTLVESDPASVYFDNRGIFLKHTFMTLLLTYPAGAGLGRWGIICAYFGDRFGHLPPLWAEIQWTGWLYDGGILLLVLYTVALVTALRVSYRLATSSTTEAERDLQPWATAVFGYNVGAIALSFSTVPFQSTQGIDFWVLNAMIFAASHQARLRSALR